MPARVVARDRVLNDEELGAVYTQARDWPYPFGPIMVLLILTGQRKSEIAHLRWDWIKDTTVTLPSGFPKNKKQHTFPLSPTAKATIDPLPVLSEYLFPAARERRRGQPATVFNGWSTAKTKFDGELHNLGHYTFHDLRRTFASKLAELRTPIHVTEKLLNHTSGTMGGIVGVYQRYSFMDEMREAVITYEQHLGTLSKPAG